jgi:hypothetical protein
MRAHVLIQEFRSVGSFIGSEQKSFAEVFQVYLCYVLRFKKMSWCLIQKSNFEATSKQNHLLEEFESIPRKFLHLE